MEKEKTPRVKNNKQRKGQRDSLAGVLTLTLWRLRQTWRQLLMIGLALLTACTIACVPPLFSAVANTAGLQGLFNASDARTTLALKVNAMSISSATVSASLQKFEHVIRPGMGSYLDATSPSFSLQASKLTIIQPERLNHTYPFNVYATSLTSLQPALHLFQGRWASEHTVNGVLEFMVGMSTARALDLTIGSTLTVQSNFVTAHTRFPTDARGNLTLRLVGIFVEPSAQAPALYGQTFLPVEDYFGLHYTFLLPSTALLEACDAIASREGSTVVTAGNIESIFHLTWYYHLRVSQIQFEHTDDLLSRLASVQYQVSALPTGRSLTFPYINDAQLLNPPTANVDIPGLLNQYISRVALINLPLSLLSLQTIALLLFFACLLVNQLVDRQMTVNAHLNSRGASPNQVRWSLIVQGTGLYILALVVGPLLACLLVDKLALQILPPNEHAVLDGVFRSPGHILSLLAPYLGGTLLLGWLAISLPCWRGSRLTLLELRREVTRESKQPFWLRYYLDVLAALLAFSSFGVSLYLAQIAQGLDVKTQELVIVPLTLVTPLFFLLGGLLLFLRAFPFLLRCAVSLVRPARGAVPMLAFIQMARGPRQATRLIMLLTLATTFATFALVFDASQNQRALDIAAYESGADFAGNLPGKFISQMQQELAPRYGEAPQKLGPQIQPDIALQYTRVPGVLAASTGYVSVGTSTGLGGASISLAIRAVDARSFSNVALWQSQDSSPSLSTLMGMLRQSESASSTSLIIPAIVDETTLSNLHLALGGKFDVITSLGTLGNHPITFQVIDVLQHIPGVNGSAGVTDASSSGGVLIDYQTYNDVYINYQARVIGLPTKFVQSLAPNYLWLRTSDNPRTLSSLRALLNSSNLALDNLYDRRAISIDLQSDPLVVSVLLLLSIGGIVALFLAFLGNLLASWVNVRLRLNSFVVLRALGATRQQIMGILLWEQGVVYLVALGFSLLLGGILAWLVVPELVFTDLPVHGVLSELNADQFYLLQRAIPPQVVIPFSLQLAWPVMIIACALALLLMARLVLSASYSQELRLNED